MRQVSISPLIIAGLIVSVATLATLNLPPPTSLSENAAPFQQVVSSPPHSLNNVSVDSSAPESAVEDSFRQAKPDTKATEESLPAEPAPENSLPSATAESGGITPEEYEGMGQSASLILGTQEAKSASTGILVTRVIDGDTIELETGQQVRYIGVDTPESVHPKKAVQCFGKEATIINTQLVAGKRVRLEQDIASTDHFGRHLRYVYVDDIFVNDYLARWGFATAASYPPNLLYQEQLQQAEREARQGQRGLWHACQSAITTLPIVIEPPSPACTIKGNISAKDEKIYHLTQCESYTKTKIDPARGERYFCREEEAAAAGWRKAQNCP